MSEPLPVKEGSGLSLQSLTHEYREESKNARLKRLRKNKRNREAFEGIQNWEHKIDGQSKEFLPKTNETAVQMKAFVKRGLTQFGKWFSMTIGEKSPISAQAATALLNGFLEAMPDGPRTIDFRLRVSDGVITALLESYMVFKVHGRRQINKVLAFKEDGKIERKEIEPWKLVIDLFPAEDYYPDPTGRGLYEIVRTERDFHDVEKQAGTQAEVDAGEKMYLKSVLDEIKSSQRREAEHERERRNQYQQGRPTPEPTARKRIVIDECWGTVLDEDGDVVAENQIWTIANDDWVIRPPEDNPFWHGESPMVVVPLMRQPFTVFHMALYDQVVPLNLAINELFNLMLDGGLASVWGVRQLRADFLEDAGDVSEGIPQGKTLMVREDMPEGMKVLEQVTEGQVPPDALAIFETLDRELSSSALSNEIRQGLLPAKQVRATEVAEASQSSAVVLDDIVGDMEHGLSEVLRKSWLLILQNMGDISTDDIVSELSIEDLLRIAKMTPAQRFRTMGHGAQLKVNGLSATLAKARDFTRFMSILQAASQTPLLQSVALQKVDPEKLWNELLKMSNINPERVERDANTQGTPGDVLAGAGAVNAVTGGAGQPGQTQQPLEGEPSLNAQVTQGSDPSGGL
jgi:hypothetical protein